MFKINLSVSFVVVFVDIFGVLVIVMFNFCVFFILILLKLVLIFVMILRFFVDFNIFVEIGEESG